MNETNNITLRASRLPEVWPGWDTVRVIGHGSFGAVYEIRRNTLGYTESAAVKIISIPNNPREVEELRRNGYDDESITQTFREQSEKYMQEYAFMRSLRGNTNIVDCDDIRAVAHEDGFGFDLYIKMELLTPLDALKDDAFTEEKVIALGRDICCALELCEKNQIIHRDVKPGNIFVSSNGNYKLGDFGVSRVMEHSTNGSVTGTPRYMAPEVYANRKYGHRADIYSLGMVLYWLLNERRTPFQPLPPAKLGHSAAESALDRRMNGEAIPAPKNGSAALKAVVLKALAYDPKERYQNAGEMRQALETLYPGRYPAKAAGEERTAQTVAGSPAVEKKKKYSQKALWSIVAAFLLLLTLIFLWVGKGRSESVSDAESTAAPILTPTSEPTPIPTVDSQMEIGKEKEEAVEPSLPPASDVTPEVEPTHARIKTGSKKPVLPAVTDDDSSDEPIDRDATPEENEIINEQYPNRPISDASPGPSRHSSFPE